MHQGARRRQVKKVHIRTYGCQMNVYDCERMADVAGARGLRADRPSRGRRPGHAEHLPHPREGRREGLFRARPAAAAARRERRQGGDDADRASPAASPRPRARRSCAAQPSVDLVVGPAGLSPAARAARARAPRAREPSSTPSSRPEDKFDAAAARARGRGGVSAFLTVQEGCDKFCTFCVVPYTRGAEAEPRRSAAIEAEARAPGRRRACARSPCSARTSTPTRRRPDGRAGASRRLIRRLAEIPGLERIRYTTCHPRDMDDDLIAAHGEVPQLMPFLHLPVQSGSDRGAEGDEPQAHRRRLPRADRADPRARGPTSPSPPTSSSASPARRDADFEATLRLVEEVGFAQAFSFKYSAAARHAGLAMPARCRSGQGRAAARASRRCSKRRQRRSTPARSAATAAVLFEKPGRHPGQLIGRSPYLQAVHVEAPEVVAIGDIARGDGSRRVRPGQPGRRARAAGLRREEFSA